MTRTSDPGARGLLEAADPAVQALAARDLLGSQPRARPARSSPVVQGLLDGIEGASSTGNPYRKWAGAHWRLVSLVELGVGPDEPAALEACDVVLQHWCRRGRLSRVPVVDGRARRCASQEGNAVAVACRLGLAADERVASLARCLIEWQWPDGGWNCDRRPGAARSSFHETLPALWGLHEFARVTGDNAAADAVRRAAHLLLEHEVVFSTRTGEPIHRSFIELHYPPYWHYDVLQALLILHRAGFGADPRLERARDVVRGRRGRDGRWHAARPWWRRPGTGTRAVEAVDWGDVASQMVTLNALRVGAGRETAAGRAE